MYAAIRYYLAAFFVLSFYLQFASSMNVPEIPCPQIFQYQRSGGLVTIKAPLDTLVVSVEFSQRESSVSSIESFLQQRFHMRPMGFRRKIGKLTTKIQNYLHKSFNGRLSLDQDLEETQRKLENGQPISYRVDFPLSNVLPRITGITVNGNKICSGPEYDAPSTTYKVQHSFYPAKKTTLNLSPTITRQPEFKDFPSINLSPTITGQPEFKEIRSFTNLPNLDIDGDFNEEIKKLFDSFTTNKNTITPSVPITKHIQWNNDFSNLNEKNPFLENFFKNQQHGTVFEVPLSNPKTNNNVPKTFQTNNPFIPTPRTFVPAVTPTPRTFVPAVTPRVSVAPKPSTDIGCGREGLTPFVVNGYDFPRGKFPWLVAIYLRDGADLKFTCGGSLISRRSVITAAHCFPSSIYSPDLVSLNLGRHNIFISEEGSTQRDVSRIITHPNYNVSKISDADIALLLMSNPVNFNQYIRPICLWSQSSDLSLIENNEAFIAGWGADNNGHSVSIAKMVTAKIVSEADCLRSSVLFRTLNSTRALCAGNRDGSGPCIGDSGGGLMLQVSGAWTLRGILSVGKTIQNNCDLKEFVVYCDVAKHITWVRRNMLN